MSETHRLLGGISAAVGVWVFISAFVIGMAGAQFWSELIVGAAVFVLAGYSAIQADTAETGNPWASGLAGLLGLWLIATPFVYGAIGPSVWSSVISGSIVAVLSGYNAYEAWETTGPPTRESTGA